MAAEHDDGMSETVRTIMTRRPLTPYRNRDVISCAIEIPGAAGGLREALKFDPVEVDIDEERVLVMKVRCKKHRYDEVKDTDALRLVMIFEPLADLTAFIDEETVKDVLQEQAERVRLAREQAAGIQRLSLDGEPDEADAAEVLIAQHRQGVHWDEIRDGCPMCVEAKVIEAQTEADSNGEGGGVEPTQIDGARKARGRARKAAE